MEGGWRGGGGLRGSRRKRYSRRTGLRGKEITTGGGGGGGVGIAARAPGISRGRKESPGDRMKGEEEEDKIKDIWKDPTNAKRGK